MMSMSWTVDELGAVSKESADLDRAEGREAGPLPAVYDRAAAVVLRQPGEVVGVGAEPPRSRRTNSPSSGSPGRSGSTMSLHCSWPRRRLG